MKQASSNAERILKLLERNPRDRALRVDRVILEGVLVELLQAANMEKLKDRLSAVARNDDQA